MAKRIPLTATLALLGCSLWAGPEPEVSAGVEEDPVARGRPAIVAYLEETRPLDPSNTLVVYELARRGSELVPALVAMLAESGEPADVYPLVRAGCTLIRGGQVGEESLPELRGAMEAAQERLWPYSSDARRVRSQLRHCEPPAPPTE